jgi:hypothetical protein
MKAVLATVFLLALAATLSAQDVKVSGQIRERSELDTKAPISGQATDPFHLLRSRLRADATVNEHVIVVFEAQDARRFGSDSIFNTASPAFTLRQGYVEVKNIGDSPLSLRLGRQALVYANERLLGAAEWSNFSQTFDAALVRGSFGDVTVDAFGAAVKRYENPVGGYVRDMFLLGAWAAWKPKDVKSTLQGFYFYDDPRSGSRTQQRHTAGVYANGEYFGFDFELDGAYQFGRFYPATVEIEPGIFGQKDVTLGAYMGGARLGYTVKDLANLRIGAGIDLLSGDDTTRDTYESFSTLYGTNHKYYGYMDYFTSFPQHTGGFGLRDLFFQISAAPTKTLKLAAELHLFGTAVDPVRWGAKSLADATRDAASTLGTELDLTMWYKLADAVNIMGGFSIFDWNGDRPAVVVPGTRATTNWGYLQTTVSF